MKKIISEIIQESKKTPEKWLPYLMLIILLGLAFVLPIYAVQYQARQSSSQAAQEKKAEVQGSSQVQEKKTEARDSSQAQEENAEAQGNTQESGKGTVVLDPGHGGFDSGMVGSSGISEKVLNLVYAQKLAALLEAEGYRVVLTRTTEEGLYDADADNKKAQDMQRRCAVIEQEQPLLTVSIHQNSYPSDASVRGPQVFYYEHSTEGEKLAASIQDCMNEQLEIARPRVQKANGSYYILKRSASVTVLVEVGFLTNAEEEALLQDEGYQDQAVKAICDGIVGYLEAEQSDSGEGV